MNEEYKSIGCVALKDSKGNYSVIVPVYVNLNDVDRQAIEESEKTIVDRVSSIIVSTFEKQISSFIAQKKKEAQNANA